MKGEGKYQLLGKIPIARNDSWSAKIMKAHENMFLGFGVIDSALIDDKFTDWSETNIIFYYGWLGTVYADGKGNYQEKGQTKLKKGDVITVSVSLQEGKI